MNSNQRPDPEPFPTAGPASGDPAADPDVQPAGEVEFAMFDPALHAAAVAERAPGTSLVMAAGWWSSVTAPEDPRALELRHIPDLPAPDAARVRELFAEVVDTGGACEGEAWEVLSLWEMGSSPSAAAAANAVMILVSRAVEADEAAGFPSMPSWLRARTPAWLEDLLG